MKIPNLIKDENIKNGIILILAWVLGVIILVSTIGNLFGFDIPMDITSKVILIPIVLLFMYKIIKLDMDLGGKVILEFLLLLLIYKTFVKTPFIDKLANVALIALIIYWLVKKFIFKRGEK